MGNRAETVLNFLFHFHPGITGPPPPQEQETQSRPHGGRGHDHDGYCGRHKQRGNRAVTAIKEFVYLKNPFPPQDDQTLGTVPPGPKRSRKAASAPTATAPTAAPSSAAGTSASGGQGSSPPSSPASRARGSPAGTAQIPSTSGQAAAGTSASGGQGSSPPSSPDSTAQGSPAGTASMPSTSGQAAAPQVAQPPAPMVKNKTVNRAETVSYLHICFRLSNSTPVALSAGATRTQGRSSGNSWPRTPQSTCRENLNCGAFFFGMSMKNINRAVSVSDLRYLSLKHELAEIKNELKDTRQQVTNVELESKDILQASQVTARKPFCPRGF